MPITKRIKDQFIKLILGDLSLPRGLFELSEYFRHYAPINFEYKKEGGEIIAISTNFRYGSIVTSATNQEELDKKIKDAILTSFSIPSSYEKEAKVINLKEKKEYALA